MAKKVLLDLDPGVPDALALCLAAVDPRIDLVAVTATGGNVHPAQATRNVQALVEQLDPPRWPRLGAADPDQLLLTDNREMWGEDGLCGADFRGAELHHQHSAVKVISDEIKAAPGEITLVAGGPLTNIAAVFQREPELAMQVGHLVIVGGTFAGPGNVTPAAEFNIFCDADAARAVLRAPVTKTLLPLDVSSQVVLRYDMLDRLPERATRIGQVLHTLLPGAFLASHQRLAMEGLLAPEAVAVAGILYPELLSTKSFHCDVELNGELTRGTTIIDRRRNSLHRPNVDVVVGIEADALQDCLIRGLHAPTA